MKIHLAVNKEALELHTRAALLSLCDRFGVEHTEDVDEADALWVSLCDLDDLPVLKKARRQANGRPVIMGGFEGFFGEPYLAWADAVVVGEGANFIEAWGQDPALALQLPCVLTREREAWASYDVRYDLFPLVKVPVNRCYYLGSRGCLGKCTFCATGWVQPYSENERFRIQKAIRGTRASGSKRLTVITNNSQVVPRSDVTNSQSIRVQDYLKTPDRFKSGMLHFGIEGWTERHRTQFAKPISDEQLVDLFDTTGRMRQQAEWFFLASYPGWTREDVEYFGRAVLPVCGEFAPQLRIKVTYLNPCPHTPLSKIEIPSGWINKHMLLDLLNRRCKRVKIWEPRSKAKEGWRTAFHRCTPDEALRLGAVPSYADGEDTFTRFLDGLESKGLLHLAMEQSEEPCSRVHVDWRAGEDWAGNRRYVDL